MIQQDNVRLISPRVYDIHSEAEHISSGTMIGGIEDHLIKESHDLPSGVVLFRDMLAWLRRVCARVISFQSLIKKVFLLRRNRGGVCVTDVYVKKQTTVRLRR